MRMWLVNPKIMCRQHLLGEWRELFTFVGTLRKKGKMAGYFKSNCFEPLSLNSRHEELKQEMIRRGYKPKEEWLYSLELLEYLGDTIRIKINKEAALQALLSRCPACRKLYESVNQQENHENISLPQV